MYFTRFTFSVENERPCTIAERIALNQRSIFDENTNQLRIKLNSINFYLHQWILLRVHSKRHINKRLLFTSRTVTVKWNAEIKRIFQFFSATILTVIIQIFSHSFSFQKKKKIQQFHIDGNWLQKKIISSIKFHFYCAINHAHYLLN